MENEIEIIWCTQTRKHYINKGYKFTNYGDKFLVKTKDLPQYSSQKIKLQCDYCKSEYSITFSNYHKRVEKHRLNLCKDCLSKYRKKETQERRYNKIYQFCQERDYLLLTSKEDIKSRSSKVMYICSKHGEHTTTVDGILHGNECYKCGRESAIHRKNCTTLEERRSKLYDKAIAVCKLKGYGFISKKEDISCNTTYIKYMCLHHGEQRMRISNLIIGRECPKCANDKRQKNYKLDSDEVEKRIKESGGLLLNKQDYKNNTTRNLKIKCPNCGDTFITSLVLFTQHGGQVCAECASNESLGEKKIRYFLESSNVVFEQEKWFNDCRDIKPLPFDFFLPEQNLIIEFDGRQHFEDTNHFSYSYEQTLKHDNIKNDYCIKRNINLIRIPYWNINHIEEILDKLISHEDIV